MASSLSATLAFGSEEDMENVCQPCDKAGRTLSAKGYCTTCKQHLCPDCYNSHKKDKSRLQHILLSNDEMSGSRLSTQFYSDTFDELTEMCEKHRGHVIKFYCKEHRALICDFCKKFDHAGKMCSVQYIPDISEQALDGKEYSETVNYLEAFMRGSEKERQKFKKISTESDVSLEEAVNAMRNFRKRLNEKLDDLEKAFIGDVKNISQKSFMKMREIETTCNSVIKSTRNILGTVKQLNETKQGNKLFMELKQARKTMKTNTQLLENVLIDTDREKYEFKPNTDLDQVVVLQKSVGNLVRKVEDSNHQRKICVQMLDEHNKCWITGMTLVSPRVLILTDFLNKSVKMVDTISNKVTSKVVVNSPPYGVANVSAGEVAVALPEDGQIILINVHKEKLVLKQGLKVEGKFCRISFCPGRGYAIAFDDPAKLAIFNEKGSQMLTVAKDPKWRDIFAGPDDVTTSFDHILVSDRVRKAVIRLSWEGEVTGKYSRDLRSPQGLALSNVDGTVFVCDNSSNNLVAISPDLEKSKVLVTNINRPYAVCFCDETKQLYMSTSSQHKAFDNYIHTCVYSIHLNEKSHCPDVFTSCKT